MRGIFLAVVSLLLGTAGMPQSPSNPVPLINWLSPPSTPPGGAGITLTVSGSGFVQGSIITWNDLSLATTFESANKLTALIPSSNIAAQGTASVTVFNPTPGGGASNTAFFSVTLPTQKVLLGGTGYIVGENPDCGTTGDFNGDGKLDLAIGNLTSNTVSILLGNGDGTFGPKQDFVTGTAPRSIAVGDFNGDGKLDLAVANNVSGTVSILLGNGDGTFAAKLDFPVGAAPRSVVVGDFNGDGKLDLAVANHDSNTVSILLGNGDGTFAPKTDFRGGVSPFWVATADFNGDGKLDLVLANLEVNSVAVLLGNGDGTFGPVHSFAVGPQPMSVVTGDFNGDGKVDLAVVSEAVRTGNHSISVLLGIGDGTFAPQMTFSTGPVAYAVGAADFNGDGKTDLAVLDGGIMLGNGDGTFAPRSSTVSSPAGRRVFATTGDFNGDGRLDIVDVDMDSDTAFVYLQIPRAMVEPLSISFPSQPVGTTSKSRKILLTNTGSATMQISGISTSGDFAQTNNCSSMLEAETQCTIEVTFQPTAPGTRTGNLFIQDNASGSPQSVSLTGNPAAPSTLTLSPTSYNFGLLQVTSPITYASTSFAITNNGALPYTIASTGITGPEGQDDGKFIVNSCKVIAAGTSCSPTLQVGPDSDDPAICQPCDDILWITFTDGTALQFPYSWTAVNLTVNGNVGPAGGESLRAAPVLSPYTVETRVGAAVFVFQKAAGLD